MGERQMNLWEFIYPMKRIMKPIRLIELFAGIGSQFKALKVLTQNVESYKICEWAYNSYCSYNAIHIKDYKDYSNGLTKEQLIKKVKGTSLNYNEPLTDKQLASKPLEWLKNAYNNIVATHNLVNIMEIQGKDLEIVDTDKYEYIMTYSFPCQDLSLAGKRLGMGVSQKQGGTRSGLLWEVERILDELENKPQILLMENVPEVIGEKNIDDFHKWENKLEQLGYKNYVEILNAKDYGIPQNRKRCFMVSVLGEYAYNFAEKQKLHLKLKDMLEEQVDEKYYLSKKMIDYFIYNEQKQKEKGNGFRFGITDGDCVGKTITTRAGSRMDDNFINIKEYGNKALNETIEGKELEDGDYIDAYNRKIKKDIASTITTRVDASNETFLVEKKAMPIKNKTKQGYLEATEGDGIDISTRMQYHRGTVQKGKAQTITCIGGENIGVVVKSSPNLKETLCNDLIESGEIKENDIIKHSFTRQIMSGKKKAVEKQGEMITLTTRGDCFGVVVKDEELKRYENYITRKNKQGEFNTQCNRAMLENDLSLTIPTGNTPKVAESEHLRIRKLTPLECMRLMGFGNQDYKAMREINMSDMAIYHMAGDSIVVCVLIAIFYPLLFNDNNYKEIIKNYIDKEIVEKE